MRSVELFTGCGGLALGLAQAGFRHELMVEWNKDACATVLHNSQRGVNHVMHWQMIQGDVRDVNWEHNGNEMHLVAGGPPCQPFSIGGKHRGRDDARDMWPQAVRAVRELLPRGFIFENVRGLLRPAFAGYLEWITAHLARPNLARRQNETHDEHLNRLLAETDDPIYDVRVAKVNAADFGVPQKRHRVIIIGSRRDLNAALEVPQPTHSHDRLLWEQWVTNEYWQRHGLPIPPDNQIPAAEIATVGRLRRQNTAPVGLPWVTVREAIQGLGDPDGRRNHVFQAGARVYPGHTGSPLDQPAKALKAGAHGVPGGENMMVLDDGTVRYFTVREAARLQGFPDEFTFPGSWTESMRQLGNAVPVELGHAVGSCMARILQPDDHGVHLNAI